MPIEYEEVRVSSPLCNAYHPDMRRDDEDYELYDIVQAKNIHNVEASSEQLKLQTYKALQEGYFPIVLGGDHSQAIGSIMGFKSMHPHGKIVWIDAHVDANTPDSSPSRNAHGMPLAYLSGIVPLHKHWDCVDLKKDLCYFGIRSYEEMEEKLVREENILVFESSVCRPERLDIIHSDIHQHFKHNDSSKYWVSFDIDGIDAGEFHSTGTDEYNGVKLDFAYPFFERFLPQSSGMDFTEVNFELTDGAVREKDE